MQKSQQNVKQKSLEPPIYPFYIKFSSQKQKHQSFSNPYQYSSVSTQPFADDDDQEIEEYDNESFQSYNSQQNYQEEIGQVSQQIDQSDLQNNIGAQIDKIEDVSNEQDISLDQLRKENEKMVRLKQQYRKITAKYKHNVFILQRQRHQLEMLRFLKDKAMDYDYEFEMSQEYQRSRVHSHSIATSISKETSLIRKVKYRRLKQQQNLNDPDHSCSILSSSRILDSKSISIFQVVKKRQQLVCKRKLQQKHKRLLQVLQDKISLYNEILADVGESHTSKRKRKQQILQKRAKLLIEQIQQKKSMMETKKADINFNLSSLRTQLLTIETKIAVHDGQIEQIQKKHLENIHQNQPKLQNNKNNQAKIVKKSISTVIAKSYIKLDKIETPKSKIKIVFNQLNQAPLAKQKQVKLFKPYSHRYYRQHTTQC